MLSDECALVCYLADSGFVVGLRCWGLFCAVSRHSYREAQMSIAEAIGYAFTAFGIGYAAGSIQRIIRRSIEVLD